ncbi:hypothetical protein V6N12_045831 [Hibiscus sabdariffa]|uniref:Uncharacterized protein n=1 Tax=Hibiscus sabdariffa TaxID=183260 RepID=A0ABR2G504_9ROSI
MVTDGRWRVAGNERQRPTFDEGLVANKECCENEYFDWGLSDFSIARIGDRLQVTDSWRRTVGHERQ